MSHATSRPPISTRHAFALAFDLAVRRDPVQSLVVPLLLRAPWVLALALLSPAETAEPGPAALLLAAVALLGDFASLLVIGAMLRLRARSVFHSPATARPAPAVECYAQGLRRIPWLLVTELARNFALALAASFSIVPTAFVRLRPESLMEDLAASLLLLAVAGLLILPLLFLGFRLAVATESVVLDERDLAGAFQRSFRLMRGRLERWVEIVAVSAALVLGLALFASLLAFPLSWLSATAQVAIFWLLVIAVTPVIQYAWTFFYLRLVEIDEVLPEVGPLYVGTGATAEGRADPA